MNLFDHSDVDADRDRAIAREEREVWLQGQLARALSSRTRMFALGFESALEACEQGISAEDLRELISEKREDIAWP